MNLKPQAKFQTTTYRQKTEIYEHLDRAEARDISAKDVLLLSEKYLESAKRTNLHEVWRKNSLANAYIAYYLPLNWLRTSSVLAEGKRLGFFGGLSRAVDFGSGPGTIHFAAREQNINFTHWSFVECEKVAQDWHQRLLDSWPTNVTSVETSPLAQNTAENTVPNKAELEWMRDYRGVGKAAAKNTVGFFSYSLNELETLPDWALEFEALCLIEPSTVEAGRKLQHLREPLMKAGYALWAPCTHQGPCPLLVHSKTDWCHQRIAVELPPSVAALEKHLPIKNATLTYSYLLARKTPPPPSPKNIARVIGDTLYERGKVRQAVCRGVEREFLSWLTRHGEPAPIPRGERIEIPADAELKGNEIRMPSDN